MTWVCPGAFSPEPSGRSSEEREREDDEEDNKGWISAPHSKGFVLLFPCFICIVSCFRFPLRGKRDINDEIMNKVKEKHCPDSKTLSTTSFSQQQPCMKQVRLRGYDMPKVPSDFTWQIGNSNFFVSGPNHYATPALMFLIPFCFVFWSAFLLIKPIHSENYSSTIDLSNFGHAREHLVYLSCASLQASNGSQCQLPVQKSVAGR